MHPSVTDLWQYPQDGNLKYFEIFFLVTQPNLFINIYGQKLARNWRIVICVEDSKVGGVVWGPEG